MSKPNPRKLPLCPDCGDVLHRVAYPGGSMLNEEQFADVRAGDWYCDQCKGDRSKTGFRYFWNRELEGVQS